MTLLYNIFIQLYLLGIRIASLWNKKAKQWIDGRKNLFEELEQKIKQGDKIIWLHCASAGEFEQGKPVMEELKTIYPSHKILVSFFSPSGYEAAKNYTPADVITYLPADTKANAKRFVELAQPQLVVFVKYEYWYHHLNAITLRNIPLILISAIFRKKQLFFKWYGNFYRQLLFLFKQVFVQDENSLHLLRANDIKHCSVAGDTRFDRVKKIANNFSELPLIKEFVGKNTTIVAGSTWHNDEKILSDYSKEIDIKIIVAPHEIKSDHINELQKRFLNSILYSEVKSLFTHLPHTKNSIWDSVNEQEQKNIQQRLLEAKTLIIDNVGMLSRLYYYATVTYVGGGFNKSGIHNTLEAAVYGKTVFFGPNYQKFKEARDLVKVGGAFSILTSEEFKTKTDHVLDDPEKLLEAGKASKKYVEENTGATKKILQFIQENRLLTN